MLESGSEHSLAELLQQFRGAKVLVTGASGFIGSHVARHLVEAGASVHLVSRGVQRDASGTVRWYQGDLCEIDLVKDLFRTVKPEIVFHLAGNSAASRHLDLVIPTFRANLVATINILTAAAEVGCNRVVLPGSLEEPSPKESEPVPSSPYAASKHASANYARMFFSLYRLPVVTARIFMAYGPGQRDVKKLIPYVICSLLQGEAPKLSSGTRDVDWIYIDDLVQGLLALGVAPGLEGCTIDLGSGILVSVRTIAETLVEILHSPVSPMFGEVPDRPFEQVRVADTATTFRMVGWVPATPLDKGLEQTVQWYRHSLNSCLASR